MSDPDVRTADRSLGLRKYRAQSYLNEEDDLTRADGEIEELRARATGDVDVDALADLEDCFERGLEELPDDVPGRGSIEDCRSLLERVTDDE